jgi:hypothetical protein
VAHARITSPAASQAALITPDAIPLRVDASANTFFSWMGVYRSGRITKRFAPGFLPIFSTRRCAITLIAIMFLNSLFVKLFVNYLVVALSSGSGWLLSKNPATINTCNNYY